MRLLQETVEPHKLQNKLLLELFINSSGKSWNMDWILDVLVALTFVIT